MDIKFKRHMSKLDVFLWVSVKCEVYFIDLIFDSGLFSPFVRGIALAKNIWSGHIGNV